MPRKPNLTHLEARAKERAAKPQDPGKTERLQEAVLKGMQTPLVGAEHLDQEQKPPETVIPPANSEKSVYTDKTPPNSDQSSVYTPQVLESTLQDQNQRETTPKPPPATGKKKKWGPAVLKFKDQKDLPLHGVIKIIKVNCKRDKAAWRYSFYVDGMTVQEYIDKMGTQKIGPAKAKQDVRWDVSKGFITVTPSE